jgi:hypothetical protein
MSDPTWPPKHISTPTVSHENSVFAVTASAQINAPASLVFNIVRDTSTYPEWCTFVPKVVVVEQPSTASPAVGQDSSDQVPDATLQLGTRFTFFAVMGTEGSKATPTHLIISDVSTPSHVSAYIPTSVLTASSTYTSDLSSVYRIAWKGDKIDFFARGLSTERFHEIIVRGEEQCEVRTWEVMSGVLAHTVKWLYKKTLDRKFQEWCTDLKGFGEMKWREHKIKGDEGS